MAAAVAVALYAGRDGGTGSPSSPESEVAIAHVHGLGVNPGDGDLYVATHYGLYRISDDGKPSRVNPAEQDTMGFTIAGPNRFVASGHPDPRDESMQVEGKPPLLGLIESSDGGRTWQSRSLLGEADFHALAVRGSTIYGWNSTGGELLASTDGRTWDRRSTLRVAGLAVHPTDADQLVAATGTGASVSRDGGRTWQALDGAPRLFAVAWSDKALFGFEQSGTVHRSDDGANWRRVGTVAGAPQAVTADAGVLHAAANDGNGTAIYRSEDGGATWRELYREQSG